VHTPSPPIRLPEKISSSMLFFTISFSYIIIYYNIEYLASPLINFNKLGLKLYPYNRAAAFFPESETAFLTV
jgi:hypothetical protein